MLRRVCGDQSELAIPSAREIKGDKRAQVVRNGGHRDIRRDSDEFGLGSGVRRVNRRRNQNFPNLDVIKSDEER